jgi:hypothetical protein
MKTLTRTHATWIGRGDACQEKGGPSHSELSQSGCIQAWIHGADGWMGE